MKKFEITPKRFYLVGKYVFFLIATIGLIRVVDLWSLLKSYDIFSSVANSIFYFVLSGFFARLQKQEEKVELSDEDIMKMSDTLDKLNLGGIKNDKKK